MTKTFILIIIFVSSFFFARAQKNSFLEGKIVEKINQQPIPYATIKILSNIGNTFSNTEGVFVLSYQIKPTDSILINAVGFLPKRISATSLLVEDVVVIELEENVISLNTVIITPLKVEQILKEAIATSNQSYKSPIILTGYYKEFVKRDSLLSKYADGIISYYIERTKNSLPKVDLEVVESRVKEIDLPEEEDKIDQLNTPINIKEIGGFASPLKSSILDSANFKFYKYKLKEITEGSNVVYIVSFQPIIGSKKSLYNGKIYIDKKSLLILGVDYAVANISNEYLTKISVLGININNTSRSLSLRYKLENDAYYLSYVGQTYGMNITSKRINQLNSFKSEFWATGVESKDIMIANSNAYTKKVLYKRGNNYKTEFWKNYSFSENTKEEIKFLINK